MTTEISLRSPLIVALDVDEGDRAIQLALDLNEIAGCFKLGPRLIHRFGSSLIQKISQHTPVFVDCKFYDIPSTMEAAIRSSFEAGATFVTIHALAGLETLKQMSALEKELSAIRPFKILNVTILTSYDENTLPSNFQKKSVLDHVKMLADEVQTSGMSGIVCSPLELDSLDDRGLYCVTPGVRFNLEAKDDQKRVMTPQQALQAGAKAFVVGRPIVGAKNPREAALDYAVTMV